MYIVLTKSWNDSWYQCFEDRAEAEEAFDFSERWHPDCWLIEGTVLKNNVYCQEFKDRIPW